MSRASHISYLRKGHADICVASAAMKRTPSRGVRKHIETRELFLGSRAGKSYREGSGASGRGIPGPEIPKSTEKMRTGDRAGRGHVSCCWNEYEFIEAHRNRA